MLKTLAANVRSKANRFRRRSGRRFGWKTWLALLLILGLFILCAVYGTWASLFNLRDVENIPERSAVYDMDGQYYTRLAGENRVTVPIDQVAESFQQALLAREDTRFYKHRGVDPWGIARAIVRNIMRGHAREGASTITQQLARNTFPLGGKTLHRKILEAFVAIRIEQNFTKRQILEDYVNRIYFGSGLYGVETASLAYFGKHAAKLNLGESAMLVGLIRSPNRFSPFRNLKGAIVQRDTVLDRMAGLKMITPEQAEAAKRTKPSIAKNRVTVPQENYALDAVSRDLDVLLDEKQLNEGGLKIYTTIDPKLQRAAESAVDTQLRKIESRSGYSHPRRAEFDAAKLQELNATPYLQGSLVAIDNRTGGIRALVGGRNYAESRYNRALLSPRQIGSTFKPFVYAAAFSRGMRPEALVEDGRIQAGELRAVSNWDPKNSDGTYRGPMPAAEGLILSRNTMSVRVGDYAGLDHITKVAQASGLAEVPRDPAILLGALEATLKDLTAAYTVFPNGGVRKQPYVIERIDDADGQVLYRAAHLSANALDHDTSALVTAVLCEVLDRGTAANARSLGWRKSAAGKTGTTNDYRDAWFVGFTRSLTCGVWVGFDQPQTIMAKGYGATLALPIWVETMNAAPAQKYPAPSLGDGWRSEPPRTWAERDRGRSRGIESLPRTLLRPFRRFFGGD